MNRLSKFWSLRKRERQLLYEATILLTLSSACLKTIPFRHIDRFLRTHWKDHAEDANLEREIRFVRSSISRAANVLPWKSLCLSRSIAEFIMLRRRGIPAVMVAGARFSGHSSLEAHAWVETGSGSNRTVNSSFATVLRIEHELAN